jgi:hypothetical protein
MNSLATPKRDNLDDLAACQFLQASLKKSFNEIVLRPAFCHCDTVTRSIGKAELIEPFFCLLKGQVTLARVNEDGAALTTAALSPGAFFGDGLDGSLEAEDTAKAIGERLWCVAGAARGVFKLC